ncbi:pilin biogenesis protein [Pseudoalteromonas sp. MMG010]|uniref:pilus assembly protein n=1 Tax=Pseudoalteromonas sp. MMG010 TaxID=2822685 RepID=UPI001B39FF0C|nr:PilC/PilY family type IV pilus protein [Pseudoalteromonas sp. MMG010]MBQ4833060.1 pilin biogenesis protein [Pseudoalteromonas sp. MMG010]
MYLYKTKIVGSLLAMSISGTCFSEDIELYVNHNISSEEKTRVLMLFDTSGSMAFSTSTGYDCGYNNQSKRYNLCPDSRLGVARDAMSQLVDDNADIDFGLMRFNGGAGGYLLAKLGSSRAVVQDKISALIADGSTPLSETLWEAYLYLTGNKVAYGKNIKDRDLSGETGTSYNANNSYYISPFTPIKGEPLRCDNAVNVILMTDGDPTYDSGKNNEIKSLYKQTFDKNPGYSDGSYLAALAQSIHGNDETEVDLFSPTPDVTDLGRVYTIGFGSGMSLNGKSLLSNTAKAGGGQYLHADTADELSDALKSTISKIRKVNDSFSSPSVASNSGDQTRSREAIYFSMFYPKTGARWSGNLKKLKVSGAEIIDSAGNQALDETGGIADTARTFWLPNNESADGNLVGKGGVNLLLATKSPNERHLYTEKQGVLTTFNSQQVNDILALDNNSLSLSTTDVNWARGIDVDDEDNDNSFSDNRLDIFGDPLHSKPVALDYGDGTIRILIGTNAGFIHMFSDKGSTVDESWAFMPSSLFANIPPLRKNQENTKVYGMDGTISVYFNDQSLNEEGVNDGVIDASKGDEVWAFSGMRRGGRNYYAIDISDPDNPKSLWKTPIEGGSEDFKELGQTWSKPQIAYIKAFGTDPLLVFGAGYDANKDNTTRTNDSVGRGIYIVNAKTGKKVWELTPNKNNFKGKHSIASDLTTLDSDYDGYVDRIYASDTAGGVWRIDIPTSNSSDISHYKLAELGEGNADNDRRFFYKPVVARTMFSKVSEVQVNGETVITRLDTPYDAVVIASGNRSNPLGSTVQDQLFMIRDENIVTKSYKTSWPGAITTDSLMDISSDPFGNALDDVEKFTDLEVDLGEFKGWRYQLAEGEKSLAAATVIGGVAYFTSYTPASEEPIENQCTLTGGSGSLYAFHLHYGTKVYDSLKFSSSTDVPDTPQLYFGEGPSCADSNNDGKCDNDETVDVVQQSQFYLISPSLTGENTANPFLPVEINGPGLQIVDGKIELVNKNQPIGFGFKTQQTFIYKKEQNDEIEN